MSSVPPSRHVCIHGHFYQPPRENPWLETVEEQESAAPHHDWNARITAECYGPNAAARILDAQQRIATISNNYGLISFNFGPTLLSWLESEDAETYLAILAADKESQGRFGGYGSALAQTYSHMIMPLANARDLRTQVLWGKRDFEHRFGRAPDGMWLPETAVSTATLEALADADIRFTILAPHQASRVRRIGENEWHDVSGGRIDPRIAYVQKLPSGRSIALFFYDGPVSQAVAFERLLVNGEALQQRIVGTLGDGPNPQLAHIATDGETYGHHHRHGEMALAFALRLCEDDPHLKLTNYAQFLAEHPPTHQVEIAENTAWSSSIGVERWRADAGGHTGAHPTWNQRWRKPLRESLDWLRDTLAPRYETAAARLFHDPWAARDAYIDLILDRSVASRTAFFARVAKVPLSPEDQVAALRLLEMQRHAQLMFTSCGWFFDDISGIETLQILQYACRAIQLGEQLFGLRLQEQFAARLEPAKSNLAEQGSGRTLYERRVKPRIVSLGDVAAHHALTSLFDQSEQKRVYCYDLDIAQEERLQAGRMRLTLGQAKITSTITSESSQHCYAAFHFGDHNVSGGVDNLMGVEDFAAMRRELVGAFERADIPEIIRSLDRHFPGSISLSSLFREDQRRLLGHVLQVPLADAEIATQRIYRANAPLMRYLAGLNIPAPAALTFAAEFALTHQVRRLLVDENSSWDEIAALIEEARVGNLTLRASTLTILATHRVDHVATSLWHTPGSLDALTALVRAVRVTEAMPFPVELVAIETAFYRLAHTVYPRVASSAARLVAGSSSPQGAPDGADVSPAEASSHLQSPPPEQALEWLTLFRELAALLHIRLPDA